MIAAYNQSMALKKLPRLGADVIALYQRKAGAHAHKNTKRRKTRNKSRAIRDRLEEG